MNFIIYKKTAFGALASAIILSGLVIAPTTASAITINDNISISKGKLKAKCKRAGGTFHKSGNGRYGCTVKTPSGGMTSVACNKKSKCSGISYLKNTNKLKTKMVGSVGLVTR